MSTYTIEAPIFTGFYAWIFDSESIISLDDAIYSGDIDPDADIDWQKVHNDFGEHFTTILSKYVPYPISFVEIKSPKYYNYDTDKIMINVELTSEDIKSLESLAIKHSDDIKKDFESYDGFFSYHSTDANEWIDNLDGYKITYLLGKLIQDHEEDIMYDAFENGFYATSYIIDTN